MKTLFSKKQHHSLLVIASLLCLPLSSSAALSEAEIQHLLTHENEKYVYCDRDHSAMADALEEITRYDNNQNSPAWQLHEHIKRGYNIGATDAVLDALAYADEMIDHKQQDEQISQARRQLDAVIQAIIDGDLDVNIHSEDQLKNISNEDLTNQIIKVREKLYVFEHAKFFKNVKFFKSVDLECDVNVGCNLYLNDSTSASVGNVIKNNLPFIHTFPAGSNNTFVGENAGNFTMTGTNNLGIGADALFNNASGSQNTAVGVNTLQNNVNGNQSTAVGYGAMQNQTGGFNVAFGYNALNQNTAGIFSSAIGWRALASNTTGNANTAVGNMALSSNTIGTNNTALGQGALITNITGNNNTGLGTNALTAVTSGSNNVAIGSGAGAILSTGSNNIYISSNASSAGESNVTRIANIYGTTTLSVTTLPVLVDNTGQLGTAASTRRVKHDIQDMADASAAIYDLHPVSFVYNGDASETKQYGLIAEEVSDVFPALVVYDQDGQPFTVQYHVLPVLLLNEIQKLQAGMASSNAALAQRIADIEARLQN